MKAFKHGRVVLLLLALAVASCQSQQAATVLAQESNRTRLDFKQFDEISSKAPVDLFLSEGDTFLVEVEVRNEKAADHLEFKMKGNELIIKMEDDFWRSWRSIKAPIALIYITMPRLEELKLAGMSDAKLMTPFVNSKGFEVSIAGSGDLNGEQVRCTGESEFSIAGSGSVNLTKLEAGSFDARIAGSGDVKVSTLTCAGEIEGSIAGSGEISFGEVKARKVELSISGSGDMSAKKLIAVGTVEVRIAGSGNVKFGELGASNFIVSSSGSGDVSVNTLREGTKISQHCSGSGQLEIGR